MSVSEFEPGERFLSIDEMHPSPALNASHFRAPSPAREEGEPLFLDSFAPRAQNFGQKPMEERACSPTCFRFAAASRW
jgi:hypothetical protein